MAIANRAIEGSEGVGISPTQNALSKLGADTRWFLEQHGVDPEKCRLVLCVRGNNEIAVRAAFLSALALDGQLPEVKRVIVRATDEELPASVLVHGIPISVVHVAENPNGNRKGRKTA